MVSRKVSSKKNKPLYRKVNTTAHGVHHFHGDDYKNYRKRDTAIGMRQGIRRGLDYTPLFKFLLSKIGHPWNEIHQAAIARLDHPDPIFWLVAKNVEQQQDIVRVGESSYYSGLFIDDSGLLQVVNPDINETSLVPSCHCCTHTFNGVPFTKKYRAP